MGIFDKFMNALGFASETDLEEMQNARNKTKQPKQNQPSPQNQYILKNSKDPNTLDFAPCSQEEVFGIARFLKNGASVRIDFSAFEKADLLRAIDFLEGVCFMLDLKPNFLGERVVELIQ